MIDKKVSIIVPVYNGEKYLRECYASLKNQTWKNIEIIFINDGSTDNSERLLSEFANQDSRTFVFNKENGGTHTARNMGLAKSTGDYITFIDPDDWLDDDTIQVCIEKASEYDLDVVRYSYVREFENKQEVKNNTFLTTTICNQKDSCKKIARQSIGLLDEELKHPESLNFLASVCFSIYKKKLITDNQIEFFNIREIGTFSDGLFNIQVYLKMKSFLYIDKPFYHYRKTNSQSATSNYRVDFDERQMILYKKISALIKNEDKVFGDAYYSRISMSTLEIALNVFKQNSSFGSKYKELKEICNNPVRKDAYKNFSVTRLPVTYKTFHAFAKKRWVLPLYFYTYMIRIRQKNK